MKIFLAVGLTAFAVSVAAGLVFIPLMRKIKAGQPILKYVETHKIKSGTPTCGGLFFMFSLATVFFAFGGYKSRVAAVSLAIAAFYMLVGFLDDFLKIKFRHNEGLKPYQKIIFQTAIAILGGVFAYVNGLTNVYLPFVKQSADLGLFAAFLYTVAFIALTNSVNLTDGLDGLAGGASLSYIVVLIAVIVAEKNAFGSAYLKNSEYDGLFILLVAFFGALTGFLVFNVSKAKVFMGDTGSLATGGLLCAVSTFTGNALFIPVIGAVFVWSSLSVVIQVARFRRTGKRVFLMAPFHHHLQLKGFTETQISYYYSVFTVITGAVVIIFYL